MFYLKNRQRFVRMILGSFIGLFILVIALLHALAFMFSMHDGDMRQFTSHTLTNSSGSSIRYYERLQTNAEWNLVYIHGTPATAAVFREQFLHPFAKANTFALDRPGFGASGLNSGKPSLEDQANAVGLLLSQLPPGKTIVAGHSYGGPVALWTVLKFTNQVAGVMLIGGSVDPAQEHILAIQRVGNFPLLSWLLPSALRQCNRELLTLGGDLLQLQPQISRLSVPVIMLHGTVDRQVPVENLDYLRNQLAAAGKSNLFDALVITNYNHFIPWEHPDAVEQAIERLTNRLKNSQIQ